MRCYRLYDQVVSSRIIVDMGWLTTVRDRSAGGLLQTHGCCIRYTVIVSHALGCAFSLEVPRAPCKHHAHLVGSNLFYSL